MADTLETRNSSAFLIALITVLRNIYCGAMAEDQTDYSPLLFAHLALRIMGSFGSSLRRLPDDTSSVAHRASSRLEKRNLLHL